MKHLLLHVFYYLPLATTLLLLVDDLRLRLKLQRRSAEQAQLTVDALRNTVLVDGMELPKPDDLRWTSGKKMIFTIIDDPKHPVATTRKESLPTLALGPVMIGGRGLYGADSLFIDNQSTVPTEATKKYVVSVVQAQTSRAVREALEKGETS